MAGTHPQDELLQHDPENACPALDAGWIPVFPTISCSNRKIERDDDSKKSHRVLADMESLRELRSSRSVK
jgi:hypothetical protein